MAVYVKIVYPQVVAGNAHVRPPLPAYCIKIYETSLTWNIYSTIEADRVEYWEVDVNKHDVNVDPPIKTDTQVELDIYGGVGKVQWLIDNPQSLPTGKQ